MHSVSQWVEGSSAGCNVHIVDVRDVLYMMVITQFKTWNYKNIYTPPHSNLLSNHTGGLTPHSSPVPNSFRDVWNNALQILPLWLWLCISNVWKKQNMMPTFPIVCPGVCACACMCVEVLGGLAFRLGCIRASSYWKMESCCNLSHISLSVSGCPGQCTTLWHSNGFKWALMQNNRCDWPFSVCLIHNSWCLSMEMVQAFANCNETWWQKKNPSRLSFQCQCVNMLRN